MRRVGVLLPAATDDLEFQARLAAFQLELQRSGWTIGRNVRIDTRWATSDAAEIRRHAAELVTLAPDVVVAFAASTVGAMLQATSSVPIVFPGVADPVAAGFVDSLARPGRNATGFLLFEYGMAGKLLELLKEIAPRRDASGRPSRSRHRQRPRPVRCHSSRGAVAQGGSKLDQYARRA